MGFSPKTSCSRSRCHTTQPLRFFHAGEMAATTHLWTHKTWTLLLFMNTQNTDPPSLQEHTKHEPSFSSRTHKTWTLLFMNTQNMDPHSLHEHTKHGPSFSSRTHKTWTLLLFMNTQNMDPHSLHEHTKHGPAFSSWTHKTCTLLLFMNTQNMNPCSLHEHTKHGPSFSSWPHKTCTLLLFKNTQNMNPPSLHQRLPIHTTTQARTKGGRATYLAACWVEWCPRALCPSARSFSAQTASDCWTSLIISQESIISMEILSHSLLLHLPSVDFSSHAVTKSQHVWLILLHVYIKRQLFGV